MALPGGAILPLDGTDIFYTTQGNASATPFLLIHGWSCDLTDWAFQTTFLLLSQLFFVIAMDLRGHGHSTVPTPICDPTVMDPITMASDAAQLLIHLGYGTSGGDKKSIVMGHSLGGTVVTELVRMHPEMFRAHVLIDPAYNLLPDSFAVLLNASTPGPAFDSTVAEFFKPFYANNTPPFFSEWHKLRLWGQDEVAMHSAAEGMVDVLGRSGSEYLRAKKTRGQPRLVVSSVEAYRDTEVQAGLDEKFDRVEVMKEGHWMHQVVAERFNSILGEWLESWGWL